MHEWQIYAEDEPTGKRTFLGYIRADSMSEALQRASECWEIDAGDLVAVQVD